MTGWLLDTNVVSELLKTRPDPRVRAWIDARAEADIHISAFAFAEIAKGFAKREAAGAPLPDALRRSVNGLRTRFAHRILPVDDRVLAQWGRIMGLAEARGRPVDGLDQIFSATALVHGLTLVTRNTRDYPPAIVGVSLADPWID